MRIPLDEWQATAHGPSLARLGPVWARRTRRCLLHALLFVGVLGGGSCGRSSRPESTAIVAAGTGSVVAIRPAASDYRPPSPPAERSVAERSAYLRAHYWDGFDFADTVALLRADTGRMVGLFARHAALCAAVGDPAPLDSLMSRAAGSRTMLLYFWMLAERVLYDPNSPLRDDELYIPVVRTVAESPLLEEWERLRPAEQLRLALCNRVGERAADLYYLLPEGGGGRLYDVRAEYTLLFVADPECPACERLACDLAASSLLNERIERGELAVLYLLPGVDADVAKRCRQRLPAAWTVACDDGSLLDGKCYDLRAIPSLYLLDRTKRVLAKDATGVAEIESLLDRRL